MKIRIEQVYDDVDHRPIIIDYLYNKTTGLPRNTITFWSKLVALNTSTNTWQEIPAEAFENLKDNLDLALSTLDNDLKSQLPRKMYGFDGTSWVEIKVTSDGKLLAEWG